MALASANCTCILCFHVIEKADERYLVSGKTKFDLSEAIRQLPFPILESSLYICRQCCDKLRKRSSLVQQEKLLVDELKEKYERERLKRRQLFTEEGQESLITKRPCILSAISSASLQTCATTPDKVYSPPPVPLLPTPISHLMPVKTKETSAPSNTSVNVKVRWPSQTRERELQPDLQLLGTMLVSGTYKQIANAVWRNVHLCKHLVFHVLKDIDKECVALCSIQASCGLPRKKGCLIFHLKSKGKNWKKGHHCFSLCWWLQVQPRQKQKKRHGFLLSAWLHPYC